MSILINKDTKVITQGITGKTGQFHTRMCRDYANGKAAFVAGVNPKKAGEDFEGIPIHATVRMIPSVFSEDEAFIAVSEYAGDSVDVTRLGNNAIPSNITRQTMLTPEERNASRGRRRNTARGMLAAASTLTTTTPQAQGSSRKLAAARGTEIKVTMVVSKYMTKNRPAPDHVHRRTRMWSAPSVFPSR